MSHKPLVENGRNRPDPVTSFRLVSDQVFAAFTQTAVALGIPKDGAFLWHARQARSRTQNRRVRPDSRLTNGLY